MKFNNIRNYTQGRINLLVRNFFIARKIKEVITPLLLPDRLQEPGIKLFKVTEMLSLAKDQTARDMYLQASPEYAMKKLIAKNHEDIFQICPAFRQEELGSIHKQEFTILEWYRVGWGEHKIQEELISLLNFLTAATGYKKAQKNSNLTGEIKKVGVLDKESNDFCFMIKHITYRNAFQQAGLPIPLHKGNSTSQEIHKNTIQMCEAAVKLLFNNKKNIRDDIKNYDHSQVLDLLFSTVVAHSLAKKDTDECLYFINEFPPDQARFTATGKNLAGEEVAKRFELFWHGIEIANGGEESQPHNIYEHLEGVEKVMMDKNITLIKDAWRGLPRLSGVAMGIDRVLMLLNNQKSLYPKQATR